MGYLEGLGDFYKKMLDPAGLFGGGDAEEMGGVEMNFNFPEPPVQSQVGAAGIGSGIQAAARNANSPDAGSGGLMSMLAGMTPGSGGTPKGNVLAQMQARGQQDEGLGYQDPAQQIAEQKSKRIRIMRYG
jgi:hypothetical protein